MNLTHVSKLQREYLGPVNHNAQSDHNLRHGSREKQAHQPQSKSNPQLKIQSLQSAIENLRMQNEGMNAMIRTKNQQILNLKSQIKVDGGPVAHQETKSVREIYYLNNLRPAHQQGTKNSAQLDQAYYQIKVLTKQRDDLKRHCEQLQQQGKIQNVTTVITEIQKSPIQTEVMNQQQQQHARVIEQYEEHIASLASKLSTVHKLQSDVAHLNQERNLILADFEGMRAELMNRIGYCEHLENELRRLEFELSQRGPAGPINPHDFQNLLNRNAFLEAEIVKANKLVAEKDQKIAEIQIGKSGYVQVTKQAFQSMQSNITSLQQKINQSTESQRKQAEKATNLQIQLNRINRQLTQKSRKGESEFQRAEKLQTQKLQLTESLTKAKAQLKKIQRKYEDTSYQLDTVKAENEKNKKLASSSIQCLTELQKQKKKAKQSEQILQKMVQQIGKIESEYRKMVKDNQKSKDMMEECRVKWEQYDKTIKKQKDLIQNLNSTCSQRIDEIDKNIERNLNLQTKLRELVRLNDSLTDEIEQYIKENHYVSAKEADY